MFRSILVPLDGSSFAEQALPLAGVLGRSDGSRVHLVAVGDDRSEKERYLAGVAIQLRDDGVQVDHAVREGKVVDAIQGQAESVEADVIVMATHGRSGLERLRLGSVAEGLVTRGVAPMLLWHPGPDSPDAAPETIERVVVALDQSSGSQAILGPLESLGATAGVKSYTLVHVAESRGAGKAGWSPLAAVQARAKEALGPIRDRLGGDGAEVDLQLAIAEDPSDGIIGIANDSKADLIAMTTHGMTGVRPTLVGSVAAQVLRKWHGALLIQRP